MKISLITEICEDGTLKGTIPTIQYFNYWFNSGYKHIVHVAGDTITLSKTNIGETGEHCVYLRDC